MDGRDSRERAAAERDVLQVLVIAATERELDVAREPLKALGRGRSVEFCVTGVGKAAAALATGGSTRDLRPRLCVQIGCAGAYPGSGLEVGDVAIATEEVFGDEGVEESGGFRDLAAVGLVAARRDGVEVQNVVPVSNLREETWGEVRRRVAGRFQVARGRLITVSTASGTEARAREMELRWAPLAESMEGAGAALACFVGGCPFLEVRGISNPVGDRYREGWDLDKALAHAAVVAAILAAQEVPAT